MPVKISPPPIPGQIHSQPESVNAHAQDAADGHNRITELRQAGMSIRIIRLLPPEGQGESFVAHDKERHLVNDLSKSFDNHAGELL